MISPTYKVIEVRFISTKVLSGLQIMREHLDVETCVFDVITLLFYLIYEEKEEKGGKS